MNKFIKYLQGGDLRSIAEVEKLLPLVKTQSDFDELFENLFSIDRLVVMRTADALEKISATNPELLSNHKAEIINFLDTAHDKEFMWHLALMVSRLDLTTNQLGKVWAKLTKWAKDKKQSRIVRVNSIQTLFDLMKKHKVLETDLNQTIREIKKENIPSINARLKKLKK
ncbi:MAG: hypothetical protein OEV74_02500 [Cyclobacteriaceae bacterium]|nr:hypothetical protein [Cyclobacteriaceae bacterium]